MHTTFLANFSSYDCWETITSSGILTIFLSCTDTSKSFNRVVASSAMTELTQCQERLKENKPIEVFQLKERLINLSWDIRLKKSDDNLQNNGKPR